MNITFIGAGRWGLALAHSLGCSGHSVYLLSIDKTEAELLNSTHIHPFFPEVRFPDCVTIGEDEQKAKSFSDVAVLSLPAQVCRAYLHEHPGLLDGKKVLLTGKGMVGDKVLTEELSEFLDDGACVLSGPSFANEVIEGKPTCVAIASRNHENAVFFQSLFSKPSFRAYVSDDVKGLELCGALKNVYALGAGYMERKLGSDDARAAYLTRALHELARFVENHGGRKETVYGLSGVGDLFMTCTSTLSRNFQYGYHFGEEGFKTKGVAEGIYTLQNLIKAIPNIADELPIVATIDAVMRKGISFEEALSALMGRTLKDENE